MTRRLATALCRHAQPVEIMVPDLRRIMKNGRCLRALGRQEHDFFKRLACEGRALDKFVQRVDIAGMMFAVVKGERAGRYDRFKRILLIGQFGEQDDGVGGRYMHWKYSCESDQ